MQNDGRVSFCVQRRYWLPNQPSGVQWEWSEYLSQLEHLENEYTVATAQAVGHDVCDNVVDLPDVLQIPGVVVFPAPTEVFIT